MGKKILLVDKDSQFRKLIAPVFESRGHTVIHAENGSNGLELLGAERPDVIIVGSPLADMTSSDMLSAVREENESVEIIFVASDKEELKELKSHLKQLKIRLTASKPLIPFVFGAKIECGLSTDDGSDSQQRKLKDFETMFIALVTKYARVLPEKLAALSSAVESAKGDPENQEFLEEVRGQAHKMKGTGGSLGFRRVGEHMAFIENSAIEMVSMSSKERERLWLEIDRRLVEAQEDGKVEAEEVMEAVREGDESDGERQPTMARILVVDEDKGFLDIVEKLGQESLVEIVKASNNPEALERAVVYPLDAALINLVPDSPEGGFKLARELRALPGYDNLPLAFISDSALVRDRVEAAHSGASLYLDKPFEPGSLEKAVQHLVAIRTGGRPRVLVTDDDEFFANTVALVLRNEGMIVRTLNDPDKILDTMQEFPPDMLLLDVMMPGVTGFEVCKMLRQIPRWQDLPIIFLTGQTGVDARVEAFRCGGDDYLPKPVVNEELLTRVKVRLDRARMLKERSDKDTITGLLLRRAFSEQLSAVLAESQRIKVNFTICLLDVDNFKKVNDTHGHLAGDRVLAGLGQLLSIRFRVDDLRARWGGEEFILAFRRERKEIMHKAVSRVLEEFSEITFTGDEGEEFNCTFSGGMATFPEDGESIFELVQTADRRLYLAKHQGRNRIIFEGEPETARAH